MTADTHEMGSRRIVVGAASLFYVAFGVWVAYASVFSLDDHSSDLSWFDPVGRGIIIGVYLVGATLLIRWVRAGRTWRLLLIPVAFVPAALLAVLGTLLAIGAVW